MIRKNTCANCGEVFNATNVSQMFCGNKCKQKFYKKKYKKESLYKKHICICPFNGHEHEAVLYYTGRGKPRVYCPEHKRTLFGGKNLDYSQTEGL